MVFPANLILDSVALLRTEQDRPCPQLTDETDGAVIVRVNVAELGEKPAGEPVMVSVYVPGGASVVVEIVRVDEAPCPEGVIVSGEKLIEPQGLDVDDWHTEGLGEMETSRAMAGAVPPVRVAVTVADVEEPAATDALPGPTDSE